MKKLSNRTFILIMVSLLISSVGITALNFNTLKSNDSASFLSGCLAIFIIVFWIASFFLLKRKRLVILFFNCLWIIFAAGSFLMLIENLGLYSTYWGYTFSRYLLYVSIPIYGALFGITHWANHIETPVIFLAISLIMLTISFVFFKKENKRFLFYIK
ncbi:UNVERIFIED_CONTAM: hypothetical protein Cloal_3353 [Acetivibrio alkalicellulosi]